MADLQQQAANTVVFIDDAHTFGGAQIALAWAIYKLLRHTSFHIVCIAPVRTQIAVEEIAGPSNRLECISCPSALPLNILTFPLRLGAFLRIIRHARQRGVQTWWLNLSGIEFCLAPLLILRSMGEKPRSWLHNAERFSVFNKDAGTPRKIISRVRDNIADAWLFRLHPLLVAPSRSSAAEVQKRMGNDPTLEVAHLYPSPRQTNMKDEPPPSDASASPQDEFNLWMLGRVDFVHKNNLKALDVLEALIGQGHTACLTLVGEGKDLAAFQAEAEARRLADRLKYIGWTSDPWALVPQNAIIFIPSRTEGMPLVATEAMMHRIRMVVSPIPPFFEGSPREVIATGFATEDFVAKVLEVRAIDSDRLQRLYSVALEKFSDQAFVATFLACSQLN